MRIYSIAILIFLFSTSAQASILSVGSGRQYSTIQAAINAASSGDTIEVYNGTYSNTTTVPSGTKSGWSAMAYIIGKNNLNIKSAEGNSPIIDGQNSSVIGIVVEQASGTTIDGFEIRNINIANAPDRTAYIYMYTAANTTVRNNNIHGTGSFGGKTESAGGLYVNYNTHYLTVKNNKISVCGGTINGGGSVSITIEENMLDSQSCSDGYPYYNIYLSQSTNNLVLRNNYIINSVNSAIRYRDSVNGQIYNNVFYKGQDRGILLHDQGDNGNETENHQVYNNTIDGFQTGLFLQGQTNPTTKNNIIVNCNIGYTFAWGATTNMTNSYNFTYNVSTLHEDSDSGWVDNGNNKWGVDPKIVGDGDKPFPFYSLQSVSPAVGSGASEFFISPIITSPAPSQKIPGSPTNLMIN